MKQSNCPWCQGRTCMSGWNGLSRRGRCNNQRFNVPEGRYADGRISIALAWSFVYCWLHDITLRACFSLWAFFLHGTVVGVSLTSELPHGYRQFTKISMISSQSVCYNISSALFAPEQLCPRSTKSVNTLFCFWVLFCFVLVFISGQSNSTRVLRWSKLLSSNNHSGACQVPQRCEVGLRGRLSDDDDDGDVMMYFFSFMMYVLLYVCVCVAARQTEWETEWWTMMMMMRVWDGWPQTPTQSIRKRIWWIFFLRKPKTKK